MVTAEGSRVIIVSTVAEIRSFALFMPLVLSSSDRHLLLINEIKPRSINWFYVIMKELAK